MGTPIQKPETGQIGRRLREFRFGLAEFLEDPSLKTLRSFAEKTRIDEDNLSNWERGVSVVPFDYVQRLKERYGVAYLFEWVYGGDMSGLSGRLSEAIERQRRPKLVPSKSVDARHEKRRKRSIG